MNEFLADLRYAARQLRRSPGFTLTALLTLALGIGVTAAVYSVIQTVLFEALPYPDADRLVGLAFTFPHQEPNAEQTGVAADFLREHMQSFAATAVMDDSGPQMNLSVNGNNGGHAQQITALRVSQGYFDTLGVSPSLGRGFVAEEDRPSGARAVILSDGLWNSVFAGDPGVIGRTVRVNEDNFTVVGVMPAGFSVATSTAPGVVGSPDLWEPLQLGPNDPGYDGDNYEMFARLKPGITIEQVQAQLHSLQESFYQQYPNARKWIASDKSVHEFRVWRLQDVMVSDVRRSLFTVLGAVVAVLLVACLNLAGLMMARTMRRSREMAVRSALGATRFEIFRLLACEGLLLALGGGLLALLVTRVGIRLLLHSSPLSIPTLHGEPGRGLLSLVVLIAALLSGCIFSLLPALFTLRKQGREMRLGGPTLGENISHARISRVLMVAQVALAMVLVSTASMLLGTFVKLRALPSGVEPKQLTVFQVTLKGDKYASTAKTTQFVSAVLDSLKSAPGVNSAAAVNGLPLDRGLNMGGFPVGRQELRQSVEFRTITPGYFKTMGVPLLAGRDISDSDQASSDPVVLIGASAAKKWFPNRSPIGESIRIGGEKNWRIVGVVADVQQHSLVETQGVVLYGPMVQLSDEFTGMVNGWFSTSFAVRTSAHMNLAEAVQKAVTEADPEIPVGRLTTMQAVIDGTIQTPKFFSILAAGFSGFALVLTIIGLFGLLSYQVTQRTREIGVRMALGADRFAILRAFLLRGVTLAAIGLVIGGVASWLTRPVLVHLLADAGVDIAGNARGYSVNVGTNGVCATAVSVAVILLSAAVASWLPARRAAAVEPMQALRAE
jgi:predicted permease